ncbi:MAG TPA: eL32 family ribosomal protein [Candidatus Nanoarchaeia archaeon]|nr:eL32 family ribosomal protein [Candidatus Nanoarchaeia archaeon]
MTNPNKPEFRREDRTKKVRLKGRWRRPKGIHSKMRHGFRGRAPVVNPGYKLADELRGLDKEGKTIVYISTIGDIGGLKPENHTIIISSSVGAKLRLSIIEAASKSGLKIVNIRNPVSYSDNVKKQLAENKMFKEKLKKEKEAKQKKKPEPKKEASEKTEEEKKEEERLEKEKVLTQRT